MPEPTLLLSPSESRDRSGPVAPTLSGGVITVPGEHGSAWQIAEATINLLANPSFEVNTAGWAASGGGVTAVSRSDEWAASGGYSLKAVTDGTVAIQGVFNNGHVTVTAGQAWTISFDLAGSGTVNIIIQERTATGAMLSETTVASSVAMATEGRRLSYTRTIAGATAERISLRVITTTAQVATIRLDAVQFEQKAYATPYIDGSMPDGTWTGTAHASSSTRASASLTAPTASPAAIAIRYRDMNGTTATEYIEALGGFGTYGHIAYSGGNLTITPTSRATNVVSVLAFDTSLTDAERNRLLNADAAWTWTTVAPPPSVFGGVTRTIPPERMAVSRTVPKE